MTTTIRVKFRPSTVAGRPGSIVYLVTHRRVVRQITTGYKIYPDEWDEKQAMPVVCGNRDSNGRFEYVTLVAKRIRQDMERLDAVIREQENKSTGFTSDDVVASFHGFLKSHSFRIFMEESIDRLKRIDKERTAETYTSAMNSFMRFRGGRDVLFDEITSDLMMEYEAWLRGNGVKKNTVSFYNRILRAVYNRAVEKELVAQHYPFKHGLYRHRQDRQTCNHIGGNKENQRTGFVFQAIPRLCKGYVPVLLLYTRHVFRGHGLPEEIQFAEWHTQLPRRKTKQTLHIKWERCMQELVDKYPMTDTGYLPPIIKRQDNERLQYRNALRLVNDKLKTIARLVGLHTNLTMYTGRHSWASIARNQDVPLAVISEGMGHDSEHTTLIYLASLDNSKVDKANELILEKLSRIGQ